MLFAFEEKVLILDFNWGTLIAEAFFCARRCSSVVFKTMHIRKFAGWSPWQFTQNGGGSLVFFLHSCVMWPYPQLTHRWSLKLVFSERPTVSIGYIVIFPVTGKIPIEHGNWASILVHKFHDWHYLLIKWLKVEDMVCVLWFLCPFQTFTWLPLQGNQGHEDHPICP